MPSPPRGFRAGPFDYHQEIEVTVESLTNLGHGVARPDGWVVFVPFTLPGERVRARVFRNEKKHSEADLVEVLDPSPARVQPPCPLFGTCGGCQYQHAPYADQLRWKHRQLEELLARMAGITFPVEDVVPSPLEYGYRSKITPHFEKPQKGAIGPIGFLRSGQRSRLVDVAHCPIASGPINEALPKVRADVAASAQRYKRGATLLLRDSQGTVLTDPGAVATEQVGDLTFSFLARDFFQNNPSILPSFTAHVAQEAAGRGVRFLVDAYCGSGLFCLTAASRFEQAAGVELSESSADWARHNAKSNQITNCTFHAGAAEAIFGKVGFPPCETAVVIDPPRKGCDAAFLDQLADFGPARIVYVSCNPATQMRDLTTLTASGYTLTKVQPFDLFPQTKHLECVVTLDRAGR